jgi:hypothetical protein
MRLRKVVFLAGSASIAVGALSMYGVVAASATTFLYGSTTCYQVVFDNMCDFSGIHAGPGITTIGMSEVDSGAGTIAANYMGVWTAIYKNGTQCRTAGPTYNPAPAASWSIQVTPGCGGGATYFDQGITSTWNGSQYVGHYTQPSPPVNNGTVVRRSASTQNPAPQYQPPQTNARGQTYGSALGATSYAQVPDLVSVWDNEGQLGYALKTDIFPSKFPSGPNAASSLQQGDLTTSSVPVYRSDGVTVIGTYGGWN